MFNRSTGFNLTEVLADECCVPNCAASTEVEYRTPLCASHIADVVRTFHTQAATVFGREPEMPERPAPPERPVKLRDFRTHVVYFLRFGDRVKIGTTTDPVTRFQSLPHDEVIGMIPGDVKVERLWHAVWADLRITGEWFHATDELLAAIRQALAEAA